MKKQFGLPLMLASALAFSACSSDDVVDNGGGNGSYDFTKGGYMAVNINLPSKTAGAFKAENEKNFDDGLPSEYAVKKATLVLFKKATGTGATEGEATFHSIYDLGNISMSMDGTQQITSTVKVVAQADDDAQDKELLGLVILNGGNTLVNVAGKSINGVNLTATTKFSDLVNSVTDGDASSYSTDGFLMMNAPLATSKGGKTAPTSADAGIATLVDVTKYVYGTKEEAIAKTAANFYVERALAKVTFNYSKGEIKGTDVTLDGTTQTNVMPWSVENWNLDVTNKKSYFVHNMTGVNNTLFTNYTVNKVAIPKKYRFVGESPVRDTDLKYRTYWGVDPNYDTYKAEFETKAADANIDGELGAEKPQYCFENTFNVGNQNQDQTTRAIVKVKLNNGNDFYVFNGDKSKLYSFDGCVKRIKGDIANLKNVHDWIVKNLDPTKTYDITAIGNATVTLKNVATTYSPDARVKVETFTVKIPAAQTKTGAADVTYTLAANDVADLNAALKNNVTKYEGGIAYYPIRIKHFGNELTPWNNYHETENAGGHQAKAGDVYGWTDNQDKATASFLGRYGVLRNNWYELEVSSITGIGEPRVPKVTSDPDDEMKQFISVNINILSWAKRVQKEDL